MRLSNVERVALADYVELMDGIARRAGKAILEVYGDADFGVVTKEDDSPLTRADLAAHNIIVSELEAAVPDVPVLSEESDEISYAERSTWQKYFLVDPLDGTKEFINRNGEFTVNIAYIEDGVAVQGVVYVPVKDVMYTGDQLIRQQATVTRDGETKTIAARTLDQNRPLILVASRRHGGEALQSCIEVLSQHFAEIETTNMGSSLKLCLVAEGKADLYPRLAPTSEWDTAAAQAIVEASGGIVVDSALKVLRYNSKENILNPYFYVLADTEYDWESILSKVVV